MALELKDKKFGRLTVLERAQVRNARNAMWRCVCDCGKEIIAAAANIGRTTNSCGCLAAENGKRVLTGNTHRRTHNQSHTAEHDAWVHMKQRCYNKNNAKYKDYGARGIRVCDRWMESFENFFEDLGPKPSPAHSVGRKNNDGHYSLDNCEWELPITQGRNSRRNRIVEIDGQRKCISEWVEFLNIPAWKPREMIRKRGRGRDKPPAYPSIEAALAALYLGRT